MTDNWLRRRAKRQAHERLRLAMDNCHAISHQLREAKRLDPELTERVDRILDGHLFPLMSKLK